MTGAAPGGQCVIVIPARYASSRLPGKPLADILGKPMIQHVHEKALQVTGVSAVIVATDDLRIAEVVRSFGGQVIMTSPDHVSGTDRLVEVMQRFPAGSYINVQCDEPLIRPADIQLLVDAFATHADMAVGTLCHSISAAEASNPNSVKVVVDKNGLALYFSRSPIPYPRVESAARYFKHIGVYAYRAEVLRHYSVLAPSMLERAESLEQLRLLDAGIRIRTFEVDATGPGVDTLEGLEEVRGILSGHTRLATPSLADVRLLITDVDGVLTDGSIYYDRDGESLKKFHVRDGLGIRLLEESGVQVAVISGRDSPALRKRLEDLKIRHCLLGVKDKAAACREIMKLVGVTSLQTACIGDDSIDLPAFEECGFSFAVADAPEYVKKRATYVLTLAGGKGAVRELSDTLMAAQGHSDMFGSSQGYTKAMHAVSQ